MTAFAVTEVDLTYLKLNCEVRSVNHRFLDLTLKLPERLRFAEPEIRSIIAKKISRGKIECIVNLKKNPALQSIVIDNEAVTALLAATKLIEQQMHSSSSFSALDLLTFPGIQKESEQDKNELAQELFKLVDAAVTQLFETREREGRQLKALIEERCVKMQSYIAEANQQIPTVLVALRKKLTDRISELNLQPDFNRLEQELVYLSQKLDVAEELDRLDTHIAELYRTLEQAEPVGRRLDFLTQELNREANTLSTKSTDKDLTHIGIELKVLIEQIREQVQNIE